MRNIHIIRRMVATMANRLKKMGLTLSADDTLIIKSNRPHSKGRSQHRTVIG